jgi:hypothetical protein
MMKLPAFSQTSVLGADVPQIVSGMNDIRFTEALCLLRLEWGNETVDCDLIGDEPAVSILLRVTNNDFTSFVAHRQAVLLPDDDLVRDFSPLSKLPIGSAVWPGVTNAEAGPPFSNRFERDRAVRA